MLETLQEWEEKKDSGVVEYPTPVKVKVIVNTDALILFTTILSFTDLVTDLLVLRYLTENRDDYRGLRVVSLLSIIFAGMCNFICALVLWRVETKTNSEFDKWNEGRAKHNGLVFLAFFLSVTDIDCLRLLCSNIGPWIAPFHRDSTERIQYLSSIGLVLEDLPQLYIQLTMIQSNPPLVAYMSMVVSVIAVIWSMGRKVWVYWTSSKVVRGELHLQEDSIG